MATLEAIRGGGGSVRVGTVGKISALMIRELESSSSVSSRQTSVPTSHDNGSAKPRKSVEEGSSTSTGSKHGSPVSVRKARGQDPQRVSVLSTTSAKRPKQKTPLEDVGNSTIRQAISKRNPEFQGKTRSHKRSYQIPMLGSENIPLEKTPIRDRPTKKGTNIVDVVDINCGNPGGSLSNRLKKLGFSKLSQSFM